MLNQVILVGRIVESLKLEKKDDGKDAINMYLAVPRNYKNANGEYDTDFIPCELLSGLASNAIEYYQRGDLIGIKGHIIGDGNGIRISAYNLTFLSSKNKENELNRQDELEI